MELFGKKYENEEFQLRFAIFEENVQKAEELKKLNPLAEFDVTHSKFGDISSDEFK